MIINTKLNYAQKLGLSQALGYLDKGTLPTFENLNGGTLAATTTTPFSFAGPLGCILSNAENLVPLGMMPGVRIQLTTETLTNMLSNTTTATGGVLSNMELCFDLVEFGPDVDAVVKSMADANGNLVIKSQGFSTSTQTLVAGSSGALELTYNQRISSIKSVFALFSPADGSKLFGSKDVTKSVGDYQFFIGSEAYPPRALQANNKAGMFMELVQAWSNCHSVDSCNTSISPKEYNCVDAAADSALIPGKFYVGCNTERLSSNNAILTGISSQLSPISLRINLPTATTNTHNATLVLCYDSLLEINVITRQCGVKQ